MKTKILASKNHWKNSVFKTAKNQHQSEDFGLRKPRFDAGFQPWAFVFFQLQEPVNEGVFRHVGAALWIRLQNQLRGWHLDVIGAEYPWKPAFFGAIKMWKSTGILAYFGYGASRARFLCAVQYSSKKAALQKACASLYSDESWSSDWRIFQRTRAKISCMHPGRGTSPSPSLSRNGLLSCACS